MKLSPIKISTFLFTALSLITAHAAELESTTPVAAKTNGEKWWNGNCERIDADIKKMEGAIDVAFVGDSITARWRAVSLAMYASSALQGQAVCRHDRHQ